jgi:hypothetical protein
MQKENPSSIYTLKLNDLQKALLAHHKENQNLPEVINLAQLLLLASSSKILFVLFSFPSRVSSKGKHLSVTTLSSPTT